MSPGGPVAGAASPHALLPLVAVGGAVGGLLRWGLGELVPDGDGFPATTFAINVLGSLALALLPLLLFRPTTLSSVWRHRLAALLGPGLLGGFTTLSAYSLATRDLLADGRPVLALCYVAGTLAAALVAVDLARRLERRRPRGVGR